MDIYTLDRGFLKQHPIDEFESAIWTERYYGDGEFELSVPADADMMLKLPKGQLMFCEGSDEPMILQTRDIKNGLLKTTGITLTQWLNNRIIRTSAAHADKEWHLSRGVTWSPLGDPHGPPAFSGLVPGYALAYIVQQFCIGGSFLDGTVNIGIPSDQTALFVIPGLSIGDVDNSGVRADYSIPFGPLYDALKNLATTYEIGINIKLISADASGYVLKFNTYKGADRTSSQSVNPVVQFSPEMDSFTDIDDLESMSDYRNRVYEFAPTADPTIATTAGYANSLEGASGFDLRVMLGFIDSIPDGLDAAALLAILNKEALTEIQNHKVVQLVDGQIVETDNIKYGTNFFMGDIVEVKGNTGVLQTARVTEYIRSQDSSGEKAYPTLDMID